MTAGLIAVREQFASKIGIEEPAIIIGTVNLGMAVNTCQCRAQPDVSGAVQRRDAVALYTDSISGLFQQAVIGGAMRLMTFGTTGAFDQMSIYHRMLINIRPGQFGMTSLTDPVNPCGKEIVLDHTGSMAVGAAHIAGLERMNRAAFELPHNFGMTSSTIIIAVILYKRPIAVIVYLMARQTADIGPIVRIA